MYILSLAVITALIFVVSPRSLHEREPSTQYDWEGRPKQENFQQRFVSISDSTVPQVTVLQMHYDCQGRLVHQESSNINFVTGLILIPQEEETLWRLRPNPEDKGNEVDTIYDGGKDSNTQVPWSFRSMSERVRTPPPSIRLPPAGEKTTVRPPVKGRVSEMPPVVIGPDRIIDVPAKPCPSGENVDPKGKCRTEYP